MKTPKGYAYLGKASQEPQKWIKAYFLVNWIMDTLSWGCFAQQTSVRGGCWLSLLGMESIVLMCLPSFQTHSPGWEVLDGMTSVETFRPVHTAPYLPGCFHGGSWPRLACPEEPSWETLGVSWYVFQETESADGIHSLEENVFLPYIRHSNFYTWNHSLLPSFNTKVTTRFYQRLIQHLFLKHFHIRCRRLVLTGKERK